MGRGRSHWVCLPWTVMQLARIGCLSTVVVSASCAEKGGEGITVASVGDRRISATELREYIERLPEKVRTEASGAEGGILHLRTMIDVELLLLEALNEGIDRDPAFSESMKRTREERLVSAFRERQLGAEPSEGEIEQYLTEAGTTRAIRLSDILVDSQDKVDSVLDALGSGKSFEDVARKWSQNRETSARGGDIGRYSTKEELIPILQEQLFSLGVGEVSAPVRVGERYSVFKVVADTTIQLNPEQRTKALYEFRKKWFDRKNEALVEDLKQRYRLEAVQSGLDSFATCLRGGASFQTEAERGIVLYRYKDGRIAAGDLVDVARGLKGDVLARLTDVNLVASFAERRVVPRVLILKAADDAGLGEEGEMLEWVEDQRKQLLVRELRERVLKGRVSIAGNEVREYYNAHPEKYVQPEQIEIQEILVRTEAEAARVLEALRRGGRLGDLARKYSIRSMDLRDEEGRFHIHLFDAPKLGGLVEAADKAEAGVLTGPVRVREGYSVFKVLSRERKRESLSEADWRVRSHLMREKKRKAFDEYVEELRKKHQSKVMIREDNLKAAFGMG